MYRTLMNVYFIIAVFSFRERARRFNVFSLILRSYGFNFQNVIISLQAMYDLDKDLRLNI